MSTTEQNDIKTRRKDVSKFEKKTLGSYYKKNCQDKF